MTDTGFRQHLGRKRIGITLFVGNINYAGVNQHLAANRAWHIRAVYRNAFNADAMQCGLDYSILFGMQPPAQFMPLTGWNTLLLPQTTGIETMPYTGWNAVISCCYNLLVAHQNSADFPAQAG